MHDLMYRSKGKRILDILMAATGLITSLPFFVLLPPVLWVYFKCNPFFKQQRPGHYGRLFTILKFRTMYPDGRPVCRFGKLLRKTSLDELPQFWNVLCGEMSIVGPRPLLAEYLPLYNSHQHLRHNVKPGITGLAQISGGNGLSWDEKFEHDRYYVESLSLSLDCRIIFTTFCKAFALRKTDGSEVSPFNGNAVC